MNKEILAVVAGEEITKAELDTYLQGVPREQQAYASNPAFREQFLEQLVSLYLFAKKGFSDELKKMAKKREDIELVDFNTVIEGKKKFLFFK